MVKRHREDTTPASGQDSFLDIVANLVGILIILVMVIGVRAKDAMLEAAPTAAIAAPPQQDVSRLQSEVAAAERATAAVERDIHRLDGGINREDFQIAYRRRERDKFQLLMAAAEEALEKRREQLDEAQQRDYDAQRELAATRSQLDQLRAGIEAAENSAAPVAVIEHLPTPMAKTVFGKEIHLRLYGGRLVYVPWDELVEKLKEEAPQKLWRLKDQDELTETLGPIGGFWMKYTLKRVQYNVAVPGGAAVRRGVELDRFILFPLSDNVGETFQEAFQDGSQFLALLAQHPPETTTITVWTYPDSFEEFRALKQRLYALGYLTASRPLPDDVPIGGSPRGSRSAAQ